LDENANFPWEQIAPDFELPTPEGKMVKLSDFESQICDD